MSEPKTITISRSKLAEALANAVHDTAYMRTSKMGDRDFKAPLCMPASCKEGTLLRNFSMQAQGVLRGIGHGNISHGQPLVHLIDQMVNQNEQIMHSSLQEEAVRNLGRIIYYAAQAGLTVRDQSFYRLGGRFYHGFRRLRS